MASTKCMYFLTLFFCCVSLISSQFIFYSDIKEYTRIVGGQPVTNRSLFAYQVSVRARTAASPQGSHICGGSLISPRHVLTAGQCVITTCNNQNTAANLLVVAGDLTLTQSPNTIYRNVSNVILHPDYNLLNSRHDVAIFELDTELFLNNDTVATIPLATETPEIGTNCTVAGWGATQWGGSNTNENLLATEVSILHGDICRSVYNTTYVRFREDMLCAGYMAGGQGTCQGDSGGPLVCNGEQVGIVSFSTQCALADTPTVYADVPYMVEWISNVTGIDFASGADRLSMNILLFTTIFWFITDM